MDLIIPYSTKPIFWNPGNILSLSSSLWPLSQVIVGFIRPRPGAGLRSKWNFLHHNLGRLTLLSSWATVYTGVYMAHESLTYQATYTDWLVPIIVVMATLVLLDIGLSLYRLGFGAHSDLVTKDDKSDPDQPPAFNGAICSGDEKHPIEGRSSQPWWEDELWQEAQSSCQALMQGGTLNRYSEPWW